MRNYAVFQEANPSSILITLLLPHAEEQGITPLCIPQIELFQDEHKKLAHSWLPNWSSSVVKVDGGLKKEASHKRLTDSTSSCKLMSYAKPKLILGNPTRFIYTSAKLCSNLQGKMDGS